MKEQAVVYRAVVSIRWSDRRCHIAIPRSFNEHMNIDARCYESSFYRFAVGSFAHLKYQSDESSRLLIRSSLKEPIEIKEQ